MTRCARSRSANSTSALPLRPRNFSRRGLEPGQTVAIMLPTCAEFFATFAGILLAGGIPVPIYPPFRADRIAEYATRQSNILRNAEARFLVTWRQAEGLARLLQPRVPTLREVLNAQTLCATRNCSRGCEQRNGGPWRTSPINARGEDIAFSAIHVRLNGRSQGRHVDARESAGEHSLDCRGDRSATRRCCRKLAAALSRHGTNRRVVCAAIHGNSAGGDVAGRVPQPA